MAHLRNLKVSEFSQSVKLCGVSFVIRANSLRIIAKDSYPIVFEFCVWFDNSFFSLSSDVTGNTVCLSC